MSIPGIPKHALYPVEIPENLVRIVSISEMKITHDF
jgi:hypothetical protein